LRNPTGVATGTYILNFRRDRMDSFGISGGVMRERMANVVGGNLCGTITGKVDIMSNSKSDI
jgi:hypothetical protein